jgi:ribonuclease HI
MRYALQINFQPCTNNAAEYEALLHGMRIPKEMRVSRLRALVTPTSSQAKSPAPTTPPTPA